MSKCDHIIAEISFDVSMVEDRQMNRPQNLVIMGRRGETVEKYRASVESKMREHLDVVEVQHYYDFYKLVNHLIIRTDEDSAMWLRIANPEWYQKLKHAQFMLSQLK